METVSSTLQEAWNNEVVRSTLAVAGTYYLTTSAFNLTRLAWAFLRPGNLQIYKHSPNGSWALVTGASDGIGYAFSEELLTRGFNVLLHGRNPEKLGRIQKDLASRYPDRSVDFVVLDAGKYDDGYEQIVKKVKQLPGKLTILLNNVGGVNTYPQYVSQAEIPHENIDTLINVNARFPTHLTRALLPILKENGPSVILNCGSGGGIIGVPYITTYSATKAYVHMFTTALKNELVTEGWNDVETMCFMIGNVQSAGNPHQMPFTRTSRQCASGCLDRVGAGVLLPWNHWSQGFQLWCTTVMPYAILRPMIGSEMKKRVEIEKKGL